MKSPKKEVFGIFHKSLKKIQNRPLKIKKIENLSTIRKFILICVQKDIWAEEILLLEVWVGGGDKCMTIDISMNMLLIFCVCALKDWD